MRSSRSFVTLPIALSLALAACSDSDNESGDTASTASVTTSTVLSKPTVSLPAEAPTELIVSDLVVGSGPAAEVGDGVIVHYVGVLSDTGDEFDSSFGAEPIEFLIGAGRVILGWDQGLVGVQQGTRRQLDIPADLAYGDSPPNGGAGLIQAGDALSFVVDVVVVLPTSDAADEPQIPVSPAGNVPVLVSTDLIVGAGPSPQDGQTVAIQIMTYRADTGELLASDWGGPPLTFSYSAQAQVFPGLLAAVKDMRVGGRRQAQVPFILMFDGQGSVDVGLPPEIDVVVVIDLVAVY
jgi:peptidylprolyl isomerase